MKDKSTNSTTLTFKLSVDLSDALEEQAKKERRTKTAIIIYALEQYLQAQKGISK